MRPTVGCRLGNEPGPAYSKPSCHSQSNHVYSMRSAVYYLATFIETTLFCRNAVIVIGCILLAMLTDPDCIDNKKFAKVPFFYLYSRCYLVIIIFLNLLHRNRWANFCYLKVVGVQYMG